MKCFYIARLILIMFGSFLSVVIVEDVLKGPGKEIK